MINQIKAIKNQYRTAQENAKDFIIKNCYWSERTYYRKMSNLNSISEKEQAVITTAYQKFIHEPLLKHLQINNQYLLAVWKLHT